jgi:C-terminal processing protease CtpA/Prc
MNRKLTCRNRRKHHHKYIMSLSPDVLPAGALAPRDVESPAKRTRGDRVTCQFIKETPNTRTGLWIMQQSDGAIVFSELSPGSPAAATALKPGMIVKSIKGISCVRTSRESAANVLEEAVGTDTVLAKNPSTIRTADEVHRSSKQVPCKPAVSKRWGIQLVDSSRGSVVVFKIVRRAPASKTKLAPLMTIKRVGDKCCSGMNAAAVAKLLDRIFDDEVSLNAKSVEGHSRRFILNSSTASAAARTAGRFHKKAHTVKKWYDDVL